MSRLLMLILAVAAIGGYSLSGSSSDTNTQSDSGSTAQTDSTASEGAAASATGLVGSLASSVLGIQLQTMPDTGCTQSAIPAEKVLTLIESLPAAQQVALAKAMNASSSLWTAQLYTGALGTGLCLPAQNKLLLLPAGASSATSNVASMVQSLTSSLPH